MKAGAKIYRDRGRLIQGRSGSWLLTFTLDGFEGKGRPGTGYQQLRGKRDDLIEHARSIGIRFLYLPKVLGLVLIDYAKAYLDAAEQNGQDYSHYAAEDALTEAGE